MLVIQVLILAMLLLVVPYFAGGIFAVVERGRGKMLFRWISGQLLLWVGIELIAVILIARHTGMSKAIVLFWGYIVAVLCYSAGVMIRQRVREGKSAHSTGGKSKHSVSGIVLWGIFGALLFLQLAQMVRNFDASMVGSDVFYIDNPFSVWVMFLAEVSGMASEQIELMILPIVFLCMSYGIFYLLGAKLLLKKREHCALFMVMLSVMSIGGSYVYRTYWPEEWLLTRSHSEMIMLGSVLVPYLVLLAVIIIRMIRKRNRIK